MYLYITHIILCQSLPDTHTQGSHILHLNDYKALAVFTKHILFHFGVSEAARAPLYIFECCSSTLNAAFHFNRKLISPATPVKTVLLSFSVCQTDTLT